MSKLTASRRDLPGCRTSRRAGPTAPHNTGGTLLLAARWNKVPTRSTNTARRPKPAPASRAQGQPRLGAGLLAPPSPSSSSLPPPAVVLQFLQLLLHQVGLGCGLGELQRTANNDKSELGLLQPPPRATAAGLTADRGPRSPSRTSDTRGRTRKPLRGIGDCPPSGKAPCVAAARARACTMRRLCLESFPDFTAQLFQRRRRDLRPRASTRAREFVPA